MEGGPSFATLMNAAPEVPTSLQYALINKIERLDEGNSEERLVYQECLDRHTEVVLEVLAPCSASGARFCFKKCNHCVSIFAIFEIKKRQSTVEITTDASARTSNHGRIATAARRPICWNCLAFTSSVTSFSDLTLGPAPFCTPGGPLCSVGGSRA